MSREKTYRCELCGAQESCRHGWGISTGVSTYMSCYGCYRKWCDSDHTLETLRELQADGKKVTS